jgi:SagB-type dehydrogenase family enzyme
VTAEADPVPAGGSAARIRRARSLVATWGDGRFCLENYLTGKRTAVAVPVVQVLDVLDEYVDVEEVRHRLDIPALDDLLATLHDRDLVVTEGSAVARKDDLLESTWRWRHDARYFHFATNDLDFVSDPAEQLDYLLRRAAETPPPSPYQDYDRPGTALARRHDDRTGHFWQTLHQRRTCRSFTGAAISRDDFADILLWTWGRSRHLSFPRTGDFVVKTSPSGGARHPIEVYPVVLAVDDIEPGIYHYSVRDNSIVALRTGSVVDLAVELCAGHEWIRTAAAVFFMTAVVQRSAWKYPSSHAYRVLHLDAGHLGQTFHLVCTELGLGPFTFAATHNPAVEAALGIDGVAEIVMYTAAVGVPAPGTLGPAGAGPTTASDGRSTVTC